MPDGAIPKKLHAQLEAIYHRYNDVQYIHPDPLSPVRGYSNPEDVEIAALIASALAFGNVKTILASIEKVLNIFPEPQRDLMRLNQRQIEKHLTHFRHRYVSGVEIGDLLLAAKRLLKKNETLHQAFARHIGEDDKTILPALSGFCRELRADSPLSKNYLVTDPADGSACKRHLMFLRWMVRKDKVDLGVWPDIPPALLVIPMDTHMFRVATQLGLCTVASPNLKAAIQTTEAFRRIAPDDPVKYDFALTRAGIRREDSPWPETDGRGRTQRKRA